MRALGVDRRPLGVAADLDEAEDLADVALLEQAALIDRLRPDPGEAVGLELGLRGQQPAVEEAEEVLDRMAVLVGDDHRDRGVAEVWSTGS